MNVFVQVLTAPPVEIGILQFRTFSCWRDSSPGLDEKATKTCRFLGFFSMLGSAINWTIYSSNTKGR